MPTSLLTSVCTVLLIIFSVSAQAEDSRVQQLERALYKRDQVIIELMERLEALERRVGVRRPATDSTETPAHPDDVAEARTELDRAPANAPGRIVVDELAAERALERSLTREGALLLSSGLLEVEPRFTYVRHEDSTPGFIMNGAEVFASETERNVNDLTTDLALRLGLPWDSQLEIGLPYRWRDVESVTSVGFVPSTSSGESGAGIGDLRVGLAKTLFREGLWRPDLIARLTWDTNTSETFDGGIPLGSGFHELRGSLTAIKRQDPIAFVGGLSYEHSFEHGEIQPGATVGANIGGLIALSPETSLRLFLSGAHQQETEISGHKIDGSERTIGSLVIGGSTLLAPGILLNISAGIGLTDDADDFSIAVSLPIRVDRKLF